MGVQAHVAVAVIQYEQQAGTAQPVGEHHSAVVDGTHRRALLGNQVDALPAHAADAAAGAEAVAAAGVNGPAHTALAAGERLVVGWQLDFHEGLFD